LPHKPIWHPSQFCVFLLVNHYHYHCHCH
jgi:hypothetical protein